MIEDELRVAISERKAVELCYADGLPRTVHPHVLFRTGPGNLCVDAYQVNGASSSGGALPDWRPFNIAKIKSVQVLDERFEIAPGYDPASPKYQHGLLAFVKR